MAYRTASHKCDFCSKSCLNPAQKRNHERMHTGENHLNAAFVTDILQEKNQIPYVEKKKQTGEKPR